MGIDYHCRQLAGGRRFATPLLHEYFNQSGQIRFLDADWHLN
jgi:hypothetical protein